MPQSQQSQPKQLVWTGAVGGVAALLWVLAIIGVIADEIHAVHAPLVNLCIGMAATASVAATKLALDYRRRGVEREWRAETEAQHTELLDAVRGGTQLQESHYRMVAGRIDELSEKADELAAEASNQEKWRVIADSFRVELGIAKPDGAEVLPMSRPRNGHASA